MPHPAPVEEYTHAQHMLVDDQLESKFAGGTGVLVDSHLSSNVPFFYSLCDKTQEQVAQGGCGVCILGHFQNCSR